MLAGVLQACGAGTVRAPVGDRGARPSHIPDAHIVHQGDTLYSIAFLYGFDVEQVAAWNGLEPPYTIYKGQRLRLTPPPRASVVASRPKVHHPALPRVHPSRPKVQAPAPSRPKLQAPVASAVPAPAPPPARHRPRHGPLSWSWPADGPVLARFDPGGSRNKGIDIGGREGRVVRAAAAGKVVYSGSGLAGYGRLIIIKHNRNFLSAYAHNRKLFVREGQWVEQNQVIARMGSSGTDRVQLHFEIRKQGRPVNPLRYLPRR